MIKEELLKEKRKKYGTDPKGFLNALSDLDSAIFYLETTNDKNLWFLKENPGVKKSINKLIDANDELGVYLHQIDWGQTDWLNLKKWKWD